ncbi:hypothetical protein QBC37DRAFT_375206 [Rhypophila decipiens]|uniref:F-box domain-containing protein n=1 Tax=Rhypophila decipiens TaxID=261697 RepID=A0AAN7B8R8_9PEZI|nr:hypothetical protein QBC37DRAFT_375206 [Rhypophila decipiens]
MASPIYKLLNVHDVVYIILGYLIEPQDILNVSSTCKSLDEAARPHLFRSINLPELSVRAPRRNKPAFHQRFPDQLTKYTRLIQVDDYSISTLHCVPRLRAIFWSNMPRSLDLLVLVQRNCPNIESLKIGPLEYSDDAWYLAGPGQFPNPPQAPRADDHSLLPLHGGVNMKIPPTIPVTFDFQRLTYLSLAAARVADGRGRFYVENIVALLRGSPNLKGLDLTGYPEGELNWVCRGGIYGPITRRRWDRSGFDQSRGPFLHLLCMAYQQSGAEPLKLRFLKLGPGAEPTNYRSAASPQDHYRGSLMDLSYLEELDFEFNDARAISLGLFPKAPKLREIWINNLAEDIFEDNDADSLRNTWGGESEEKCQYLATKLAEEYDKLSYVRVDDMAWRIYRASPEDGAAGPCSYPELLPVPKGDVDRELPWAFDTSMPGFQPSHQWLRPVPCRKI